MDDHLRLVGRKGDELPIAVRSQHLGREAGPSAALQIELLGKFRCGLIAKSASDPGLDRQITLRDDVEVAVNAAGGHVCSVGPLPPRKSCEDGHGCLPAR